MADGNAVAEADAMLADYDIQAPTFATDLIDQLQTQPLAERPGGLMASLCVDELLLASENDEVGLPLPEDEFHLSIAPCRTDTHERFYHSLTTCVGERSSEDLHVTVADDASEQVLFDSDNSTFENGFFDVTLPAGLDVTVLIDGGERT